MKCHVDFCNEDVVIRLFLCSEMLKEALMSVEHEHFLLHELYW